MIEVESAFWEYPANWVVLPTNCKVKKNGDASIEKGMFREGVERFEGIDKTLGKLISERGSQVFYLGWFERQRVFSFPVREHWRDTVDAQMVHRSCQQLLDFWESANPPNPTVIIPELDCKLTKANWSELRKLMGDILVDNHFVVVTPPKESPTENSQKD